MDAARARRALLELSQPALVALELSGPLAKLALTGSARTPGDGFVSGLRGSVESEAADFGNDELAASALVALHNVERIRRTVDDRAADQVPVPPAKVFVQGLIDGITALIEAPVTGAKKRARVPRTSPQR